MMRYRNGKDDIRREMSQEYICSLNGLPSYAMPG